MAGRKNFVAGEILTAADVNSFLMDQSVMVFDDSAARGSAIPTPSEGMVTYLKSDDQVTVFDGAAFKPVGGLVAVKEAVRTAPVAASATPGGEFSVPDLSVTHSVSDSANKLIIMAVFGQAASTSGRAGVGMRVYEGSTLIGQGDAAGSALRVSSNQRAGGADNLVTLSMGTHFVHTPGAGSKTYTVRAVNPNNATHTIYINRPERDIDDLFRTRTISSLIIMEVAV